MTGRRESIHLRTSGIGDFSVFNLFNDDDEVIIALPHRVSITLHRIGTKIYMDCDLGMVSSSIDLCRIGEIDISKLLEPDYQSVLVLDTDFTKRACSFEKSFFAEKFIRGRAKNKFEGYNWITPGRVFGDQWIDQVYLHLAEPAIEQIANIEFGVFCSDTEDDKPLSEPALTLCSSIKLMGAIAHYWFFIEWSGNEHWTYEKNFFYNNTVFPPIAVNQKPNIINV